MLPGIEPGTSQLRAQCATNWAIGTRPTYIYIYIYIYITVYQKGLIFGIVKSGKGICEIGHELNISINVMSKIIKQGEPTGNITSAYSKYDWKMKIPYKKCHNLIRIIKTDCFVINTNLLETFTKLTEKTICKKTLQNKLKKASFNNKIVKCF